MKPTTHSPIGVFDSGVGGISVLKELCALLPAEDFIFFGDSKNAPYGVRSAEEVCRLSCLAAERLLKQDCKELVIACNTASAIAADTLRCEYPDLPVVAIEPALKPAVLAHPGGNILLMATPLTLKTPRFGSLAQRFEEQANTHKLACPGLVELIEEGHLEDEILMEKLKDLFSDLSFTPDAVVLGCTHYPHIRGALRRYFGETVPLYDGGQGTARRAKELLEERGLLRENGTEGTVTITTSSDDPAISLLARRLLRA